MAMLLLPTCSALSPATLMTMVPDPVLHFSVGAVAGGAGAVAAYPFDYVKSQLQTSQGKLKYKTGMDVAIDTLQNSPRGVLQFYKGVGVQVLGIAPEKGIKLGVNDVLATMSRQSFGGAFPLWAQILSGGLAGACQVVASSPLEVMKVGLQTSNKTMTEVWDQVGGIPGLFRGAEACIFRDVVFTAICFPLYTYLLQQGVPPFVAGAISGVVSSFAATPPDVIKTRILSQDEWTLHQRQLPRQQQGPVAAAATTAEYNMDNSILRVDSKQSLLFVPSNATSDVAPSISLLDSYSEQSAVAKPLQQQSISTSSNPWAVLQTILKYEGPAVLFSGVSERCIGAVPRFGTTLAMHDVLEQIMQQAGWLSSSS